MDNAMLNRFYARVNAAHNKGILPTMQHLDGQNHYVTPRPKNTPKEKAPVTTYKVGAKGTRPWPTPAQAAADAEAMRQDRIATERLANLAKARAAKSALALARAAKPASKPAQERQMSEIATLQAQIANLTAAVAALAGLDASPAPEAPRSPAPETRQVSAKPAYVATSVKLTNHGHGQYSQEISGTKVAVAWDGASKVWAYTCGTKRGTAADRGAAVASLNTLLASRNLPPVRA